jgi:hypothetical protein
MANLGRSRVFTQIKQSVVVQESELKHSALPYSKCPRI